MTLTTTIISCEARADARAGTTPQLKAAGLDPVVFLSPCNEERPAGARENAIVSATALTHALKQGGDTLFCEDDIDLAPDFPRHLALAQAAQRVTYLYLHDTPHQMVDRYGLEVTHAILKRASIPAGLYQLRTNEQLMGAQCIYIPKAILERLPLRQLAGGSLPIDKWLSLQWVDLGVMPFVALPHPVQHRQVRVARAQPLAISADKRSRSFDLERRWSD